MANVLTCAAAANIGSIIGIGSRLTPAAPSFMTGFQSAAGELGPAAFVARTDELAESTASSSG